MKRVGLTRRGISRITAAIIIIIIIIVAAGLVAMLRGAGEPETVKIGFFAPLTGPASADGNAAKAGAEIAVEILNENGGVLGKNVELVVYDDALNPDQAIAVSQKMIQEDGVIAAVSGSYSSTTLAASSVFEDSGVPLVVAYAVNPLITEGKKYVFRVGMLAETEGRAAAYAAAKLLGLKKAAILYIDNPYGDSLASTAEEYIKKYGGEVLYKDKFQFPTQDFSPWLSKVKNLEDTQGLDALLIIGYYQHAVAVKQARDMGIKARIIGAEGFDSPKFIEIAGSAAEGVIIVTDFDRDSQNPMVKEFIRRYREKTGIEPDMVAASSFDAVMVLAKAIEKAGSLDREAITNALLALKDYNGVAGKILYFTPGHNAVKELTLQIIKNGKFGRYAIITEEDIIKPTK
ncbi:MAG: ABC transporter substrate-binding protein [Desulfurococcales archaeon]|nr:ABC transporter substrate-binding protein [Desulfurococcales archaeon]